MLPNLQQAIQLSQSGLREEARALFLDLEPVVTDSPALLCVYAHFRADLETDPRQELFWDLRSLKALERTDDDDLKGVHEGLNRKEFYASIHLIIAESYRKTGDLANALVHAASAEASLELLPADGYKAFVRQAVARLRERLGLR